MGVLNYALAGMIKGGADAAIQINKEERDQSIWEARQRRLEQLKIDAENRNKDWYREKTSIDTEAAVSKEQALTPVMVDRTRATGEVSDEFAKRAERRRLESQKELESMKQRKPVTVSDGSALVDPASGEVLYENKKEASSSSGGYYGYKDQNQLEGKLLAASKFVLGFSEQTGWVNEGDKAKAAKIIKDAEDLIKKKAEEGNQISASRAVAIVSEGKESEFTDKRVGDAIERFAQHMAERDISSEFGTIDKVKSLFTGEYDEKNQAAAEKAEQLKIRYMMEARKAYNRAKQIIERNRNNPEVRAEVIRKLSEKGIPTEGL